MRIVVTGGTGLVGRAAVRALIERGHGVRALARRIPASPLDRVDGVVYVAADVTDRASLRGAFDDCEVVVHAGGAVSVPGGVRALERLNVQGTRHVLDEALRAGVRRVVLVSSLGADRGASEYHRTKREAECLVIAGAHEWTVLRPGNVYGPGESHIGRFVRAMRTWPVVPVPGDPDVRFQPIWVDDLAACVARACEDASFAGRIVELAGPDTVSQRELHDWVGAIVGRRPPLVPVPAWLVRAGADALAAAGVPAPVTRDEVTMVAEGNLPGDGRDDVLAREFGLVPTRLAEGLRRLARETPEQLPGEGVGTVRERRLRVRLTGSRLDAAALVAAVAKRFVQLMPSETADAGTEPTSNTVLRPGAVVSISMPLRGHVQVRVEDATPTSVTCATLAGHPLAGMVRFRASDDADGRVTFEVCTIDHAGTWLDRAALALGGRALKSWTWRRFVRDVVALSGGQAHDGIERRSVPLDDEETARVRRWLEGLACVQAEERGERPGRAADQPATSLPGT